MPVSSSLMSNDICEFVSHDAAQSVDFMPCVLLVHRGPGFSQDTRSKMNKGDAVIDDTRYYSPTMSANREVGVCTGGRKEASI